MLAAKQAAAFASQLEPGLRRRFRQATLLRRPRAGRHSTAKTPEVSLSSVLGVFDEPASGAARASLAPEAEQDAPPWGEKSSECGACALGMGPGRIDVHRD